MHRANVIIETLTVALLLTLVASAPTLSSFPSSLDTQERSTHTKRGIRESIGSWVRSRVTTHQGPSRIKLVSELAAQGKTFRTYEARKWTTLAEARTAWNLASSPAGERYDIRAQNLEQLHTAKDQVLYEAGVLRNHVFGMSKFRATNSQKSIATINKLAHDDALMEAYVKKTADMAQKRRPGDPAVALRENIASIATSWKHLKAADPRLANEVPFPSPLGHLNLNDYKKPGAKILGGLAVLGIGGGVTGAVVGAKKHQSRRASTNVG